MNKKVKIDDEINSIKAQFNSSEDTSIDYIGPELKGIQSYVLASHARCENGLEMIIRIKIKEDLGKIERGDWIKAQEDIYKLLYNISYRNKIEIIKEFDDINSKLVEVLIKVNTIRIEFAHPRGFELMKKYNYNHPKEKQNIRDLFRVLKYAEDELNKYFQEKLNV